MVKMINIMCFTTTKKKYRIISANHIFGSNKEGYAWTKNMCYIFWNSIWEVASNKYRNMNSQYVGRPVGYKVCDNKKSSKPSRWSMVTIF